MERRVKGCSCDGSCKCSQCDGEVFSTSFSRRRFVSDAIDFIVENNLSLPIVVGSINVSTRMRFYEGSGMPCNDISIGLTTVDGDSTRNWVDMFKEISYGVKGRLERMAELREVYSIEDWAELAKLSKGDSDSSKGE